MQLREACEDPVNSNLLPKDIINLVTEAMKREHGIDALPGHPQSNIRNVQRYKTKNPLYQPTPKPSNASGKVNNILIYFRDRYAA